MPALEAFGRKWEIGSDDLVYPSIRNLFIRIPWLIGTAVICSKNYQTLDCAGGAYIKYFLYGSISILSLMILGDILLIYNSSRGGIMETEARRFVPFCLYFKFSLYILEFGWNILGTYGLTQGFFVCKEAPETHILIQGLIICNWVVLGLFIFFWLYEYDPCGSNFSTEYRSEYYEKLDNMQEIPFTTRSRLWKYRLRFVFCLVWGEGKSRALRDIYEEAGRVYSYMFDGILVFSDVVAGLVLQCLRTELLREKLNKNFYGAQNPFSYKSSINYDPVTEKLSVPASDDWNSIPSILHYFNYVVAIFTIPSAYYYQPKKLPKALCLKTQCCNFIPGRKQYPIFAEHDDCCYGKSASLRTFVKDEDLVYASYDNSDFCCPFFIAMDHSTKSIIVAIRGSFSTVDILVDSSVTPATIDFPGYPPNFKAHRGILNVSKVIKRKLDQLDILPKLTKSYPEYKILLTGLSLGAAVATILALVLRFEYPTLRCIGFSTPGGTVSYDVAEYCNDFVTTIVYGDDLVPRLSIKTFKSAVNQIESILYTSRTPKYRIQMGIICSILGIRKLTAEYVDNEIGNSRVSMTAPESPVSNDFRTIDGNNGTISPLDNQELNITKLPVAKNEQESSVYNFRKFCHFAPGKILHFTETPLYNLVRSKGKYTCSGPRWEVRWVERTELSEVIFSNRMLKDHFPFRLKCALKYFSQFVPDVKYRTNYHVINTQIR